MVERAVYTHVYHITQSQASSIHIQFAWMVHNERTTNWWLPNNIIVIILIKKENACIVARKSNTRSFSFVKKEK